MNKIMFNMTKKTNKHRRSGNTDDSIGSLPPASVNFF